MTHDKAGRQTLITWFIDLIASYILSADKNWELKGRMLWNRSKAHCEETNRTPRPADCCKHWDPQNWKRRHSWSEDRANNNKKKSFGTLHGVWINFSQLEQPFSSVIPQRSHLKAKRIRLRPPHWGSQQGGSLFMPEVLEINLMSKSSSPAHSYHAPQGCIFNCLSNIHSNCSSPCPFCHNLFIL